MYVKKDGKMMAIMFEKQSMTKRIKGEIKKEGDKMKERIKPEEKPAP